jgi:hypothetical protein
MVLVNKSKIKNWKTKTLTLLGNAVQIRYLRYKYGTSIVLPEFDFWYNASPNENWEVITERLQKEIYIKKDILAQYIVFDEGGSLLIGIRA